MTTVFDFVFAVALTFISAVLLLTLVSCLWAAYENVTNYLEKRHDRA